MQRRVFVFGIFDRRVSTEFLQRRRDKSTSLLEEHYFGSNKGKGGVSFWVSSFSAADSLGEYIAAGSVALCGLKNPTAIFPFLNPAANPGRGLL